MRLLAEEIDAFFLGGSPSASNRETEIEYDDNEGEFDRRRGSRGPRGRVVLDDDNQFDLDSVISGMQNDDDLLPATQSDGGRETSIYNDDDNDDDSEQANSVAEEDQAPDYPDPPRRIRRLPDLLRSAGLGHVADAAPNVDITSIITCNSESAQEGALYVCVPSEDGEFDGHDWADDAAELGAIAVLADRPLPGCLLPVVVVDSALRALGPIAAEFYGELLMIFFLI